MAVGWDDQILFDPELTVQERRELANEMMREWAEWGDVLEPEPEEPADEMIDLGYWRIAKKGGKFADASTQLLVNLDNAARLGVSIWNSTRLGRAINWAVFGGSN